MAQAIPGIDAYVPKNGVLIGDALLAGRRVGLQKRAQEADENRQKMQGENDRIRQQQDARDFELRKQQGEAELQYRRDALKQQEAIRQRQEAQLQEKLNQEKALQDEAKMNQMAEALALQETLTGEPNTQADYNLRSTPGWATGAAKGAMARADAAAREKVAGMRATRAPKESVTPGVSVIGDIPIFTDSKGNQRGLTETEMMTYTKAQKAKNNAVPPPGVSKTNIIGRVMIGKDGKPTFQKTESK